MTRPRKIKDSSDQNLGDLPNLDLKKIEKILKKQQQELQLDPNTKQEDEIIQSMYELLFASIDSDGRDKNFKHTENLIAKINKQCEASANKKSPKTVLSAEKKVNIAIQETHKISKLWGTLQDFLKIAQPINKWETNVFTTGRQFYQNMSNDYFDRPSEGYFTKDLTTGDLYCDDDNQTLRLKLFLLSLGTCTVNLIALLANSVYRLAKIITFYELQNPANPTITNLKNYGSDIARLVFGPLVLISMQITAVLGTITPMKDGPRDARKMYALGESLIFGFSRDTWRLAPCFRPDPQYHLFGGKIGKKNEW